LDYECNGIFTPLIDKEVNDLKGKVKTMKMLTKLINDKFDVKFDEHQIQYRVNKFMRESFGRADQDAFNFVSLAKEDVKINGGYFNITLDGQHFKRSLCVSNTMLKYAKKFLDVVIIDATYKRNRFNLPLVNIIGVNNHGQNILLGFGLISNEDNASYDWIFYNLKLAWKRDLENFIVDEYSLIKHGTYFYFTILIK